MGEPISEGGILATTLFDECASNPQRLMRVAVHNALNYTGQVEAGFTSVVDGVGSYQLHSPIVLGVSGIGLEGPPAKMTATSETRWVRVGEAGA
jgi:hypothetical protein